MTRESISEISEGKYMTPYNIDYKQSTIMQQTESPIIEEETREKLEQI